MHLPVLPNFDLLLMHKHVEYFDQQTGARGPILCGRGFEFGKVCTIILLGMMAIKTKWAYYKLIELNQQKKFRNEGFESTKF